MLILLTVVTPSGPLVAAAELSSFCRDAQKLHFAKEQWDFYSFVLISRLF